MKKFCLCENELSKCGAFDMPEWVLVCGFHKGDLAWYLSQIAAVVHACMVVEGADRYRAAEPAFDIHYPDPTPMLDCLANVVGELADVADDTVFPPELLEFIRSLGYLGHSASRSHLLAAAHYIRRMADGGPLVEDTIRQYAVRKILLGERPEREGGVRFVGLQEILPLARKAFPLDLVDDMRRWRCTLYGMWVALSPALLQSLPRMVAPLPKSILRIRRYGGYRRYGAYLAIPVGSIYTPV